MGDGGSSDDWLAPVQCKDIDMIDPPGGGDGCGEYGGGGDSVVAVDVLP